MKACEAVVSNNGLNTTSMCTCLAAIVTIVTSVALLRYATADMMHYKFTVLAQSYFGLLQTPCRVRAHHP